LVLFWKYHPEIFPEIRDPQSLSLNEAIRKRKRAFCPNTQRSKPRSFYPIGIH